MSGTKTTVRGILYFNELYETQDPKKIFNAIKCSQKINKNCSVDNIV